MKHCGGCGLDLEVEKFSKRGKGLQPRCKACTRTYYAEYYKTDRERTRLREKNRELAADARAWLDSMKQGTCADCGVIYPPYVMDFDHLSDNKLFNVADAVRSKMKRTRVVEEIAKCELVCANCHRIRTYERLRAEDSNLY